MASKEFLLDRITKAQEQITKKQETIQRMEDRISKNLAKLQKMEFTAEQIEMGLENPWNLPEDHPKYDKGVTLCEGIENAQYSITNAQKVLPELQEKLQKYQEDLQEVLKQEQKLGQIPEVLAQYEGILVKHFDDNDRQRKALLTAEWKRLGYKNFFRYYKGSEYTLIHETEEETHKNNTKTAHNLILNLWDRVKDICTDVTKCNLHLENANEWEGICINGVVIGSTGTARVESITAGGYNIQKLHIRTLVHRV